MSDKDECKAPLEPLALPEIKVDTLDTPPDIEFNMKDFLMRELCCVIKDINDTIYGSIELSKFAVAVIDTKEFQRLRDLKQLGSCLYIYQNAVHTRFDHSVGTYHLSSTLCQRLARTTSPFDMDTYLRKIPYLKSYIDENYGDKPCHFDDYIQELINIAALCHDLGHGAFSHIFDDEFVKKTHLKDHPNAVHEMRSGHLVEIIIRETAKSDKIVFKAPNGLECYLGDLICDDHIEFIKKIIDPDKSCIGFVYQIVSNSLNSMDVDKYDYLTRDALILGIKSSFDYKRLIDHALVISDNIAYPEQCAFDIYNLFRERHRMHKQTYAHKGVISSQLMITDLMLGLNKVIDITGSITDMKKFCKITDAYIMEYSKFIEDDDKYKDDIEVQNAIEISNRLRRHDLYATVMCVTTEEKLILDKELIFATVPELLDDIIVFNSRIGYVSGNKSNPLNNIFLYKTKSLSEGSRITALKKDRRAITNLVPDVYQEYLNMIFFKRTDRESKKKILPKLKKIIKDYMDKTYPLLEL